MTLNKKILAAAIVGGLFAANAQAQVVLSPSGSVTDPVTFASELVIPGSGSLTLTNLAGALNLTTNLRYSFSEGEVRYARFECPSNIRFATGAVTGSGGATFGAINGLGTNVITFSITAGAGNPSPTNAASTITVSGDRSITSTAAGACSYSLYDEPSQALAGGTAGRITTVSGNYLAFATSYTLSAVATGAVANVEASPSFSRFVSAAPTNNVNRASLGNVTFALRTAPTPLLADGTAATLAALLAAGSNHVVTGDFANAANADGTFTGTAVTDRVFFGPADCSAITVAASAVTATTARFNTGAGAVGATLCYAPRSGVAIPVSTYTQSFNAVSANTALYAVSNLGPVNLGSITRNGTSLQAPFVQVPAGWLSRIVLTNTGSVARPYTITAQTEAGVTSTLGAGASGTIPANGTIVLNTSDIATFTGATRGTLNATIAGPNNDIQGLYQIVNGATGSIANTAMVRPSTN